MTDGRGGEDGTWYPGDDAYQPQPHHPPHGHQPQPHPYQDPYAGYPPPYQDTPYDSGPADPQTVGLRPPADLRPDEAATTVLPPVPAEESPAGPAPLPPPGEGRAARRKAARAAGRHGAADRPPARPDSPATGTTGTTALPETGGRAARRKAAKAAAKAAKQTGTAISNVIGELFITTGVLLMLFVVYQLWWTNVEARAHANGQADSLQEQWDRAEAGEADEDEDREPGVFSPGEGFAIIYLPTLDVRAPIAEGVDPKGVLDKGMVGHYTAEDRLPTAMPWDEEGNFGLAGHRNTHGEPFRFINKLEPGDPIVIETESTYYVYEMASRLDSTSPSNIAVLDPVPDQGGFTEPGRYITLTTCTPEFTSTYRMIVWGQLTEERPRSEGKPDALVD
ncbi:class E sortase [Streptomyces carpaticus]|uniref:class E sortase n=1 Tax=Streptomyces carpaticus TaxID=285558 RepID=UPI0022082C03|nr:class E sortase [Streptomyces carpaticus]